MRQKRKEERKASRILKINKTTLKQQPHPQRPQLRELEEGIKTDRRKEKTDIQIESKNQTFLLISSPKHYLCVGK